MSPTQQDDSVLLIPDYEESGEKYPGNLQPGYYNKKELAMLLYQHRKDPKVLQFIADMLETGDPSTDAFATSLRRVARNSKAREQLINTIMTWDHN